MSQIEKHIVAKEEPLLINKSASKKVLSIMNKYSNTQDSDLPLLNKQKRNYSVCSLPEIFENQEKNKVGQQLSNN